MSWSDWSGYLRDLAGLSAMATVLVYVVKLALPASSFDRLASVGLALAFVASGAALWAGLFWGAVPAWALFAWPLLGVFWMLEGEFGTRILGLVAACSLTVGQLLLPWRVDITVHAPSWSVTTAAGTLVTGGLEIFALATWVLALLLRLAPALSSRKTARFFAISVPVVAELAYRINVWGIPFALFAALAALAGLVAGQIPLAAVLLLALASVLGAGYAATSRQRGRPIWLVLSSGALVACIGVLGLFTPR